MFKDQDMQLLWEELKVELPPEVTALMPAVPAIPAIPANPPNPVNTLPAKVSKLTTWKRSLVISFMKQSSLFCSGCIYREWGGCAVEVWRFKRRTPSSCQMQLQVSESRSFRASRTRWVLHCYTLIRSAVCFWYFHITCTFTHRCIHWLESGSGWHFRSRVSVVCGLLYHAWSSQEEAKTLSP